MKPFYIANRKRWAIDIPPILGSKRIFFKTEVEAQKEALKVHEAKEAARFEIPYFSPSERLKIKMFLDKVGGFKALDVIATTKAIPSVGSTKTVNKAVELFHKEKEFEGIGFRQKVSLKSQLRHLQTTHGNKRIR